MVHKVLEGLHEEAFELARDTSALTFLHSPEGYVVLSMAYGMSCFPVPARNPKSSSELDKRPEPWRGRAMSPCRRTSADDVVDGGNCLNI